jgi:hypothetical protein
MIYRCRSGSECTQTFTTERGLNIHRQACDHYKRHEAATFASKRKTLVERKKAVAEQNKAVMEERKKQKGRAGVPGVSLPFYPDWQLIESNGS